ncbi:uncharacterized protein [Blastocystis hominis]|uniref:Myosin motor domain-containing protein n=1 Tax=Blastocystis hominis TaxID=12968 RepID=D8M5G1_BLAHO|nr:uncharacterized protein [Blastocystis hominis]CBK23300.2 unnamed protein product [Blastocystis hominis]|eukprot:XP_012897348.1 uncharacterized protein [Blastocystis hominis]
MFSSQPATRASLKPSIPSSRPANSSPKPSDLASSKPANSSPKPSDLFSSKPVKPSPSPSTSFKSSSKPTRSVLSGGGWEERYTADDVPYYYHKETDSLSWDKPECLLTEAEKAEGRRQWVWIADEAEGWVPVCVESAKGSTITGRREDGTIVTSKQNGGTVQWSSLRELPDDVVLLEDCNEPSILYTVRKRYMEGKIYTWVGSNKTILLSVNPFQNLPLYSPEQISLHANPPPNRLLPPHVYDIAYSAFQEMSVDGTDQSILISGESGAGKTEATKQCLGFIAEVAGSDSSLEQKVLQTNPVLEAFGNAKTVRNNNSSRFGKWIEVHFSNRNHVCGASIECYLLEKSRVVDQQKGERNFHIFYQLLSSPDLCRAYNLTSAADYRYLTAGQCLEVEGMDDKANFLEVLNSFESLGFSQEDRESVLSLLAAILKLGNIKYEETGGASLHPGSSISNEDVLCEAATLLQIPANSLKEAICTRRITVKEGNGVNVTIIPLSCREAIQNCDALAKELYSRLFDWIVEKINLSLRGERNKFIGFLDIFGFEIFEKNSFEQLCINYANERLQQLFNSSTFKEEETVYRNEGVEFQHVDFIDNSEVLDMLENRFGGLFCAIDDQVKIRGGTDENLMKAIRNTLTKYSCFDGNCRSPLEFGVCHYAGKVTYTITGFTDKNRDRIFDYLYELVSSSSSPFIASLFPPLSSSTMRTTVCSKFQKQLKDLLTILQASQRKYIRCVKPNDKKRPRLFDCVHSLEQLRYSGVFEAVKIRKEGYPFRYSHQQFVHRYRCLPMTKGISVSSDVRQAIQDVIRSRPECKDRIYVGRSLVLYRAPEHRILELARNLGNR